MNPNHLPTIRVAAVQLATGTDIDVNLGACVRGLEEAARCRPDLVVLPEFCNHLSWYDGPEHCYQVSVTLDGPFLDAIAERARSHRMFVVVNCTVRRGGDLVTATSVLFDPRGELLAVSDKQVLIGHENDFLARAQAVCPVVETSIGRLAMYACMDGVISETPRGLALAGAEILCNRLNSFALDEASLHVPVRAAENRVFVVAANKVGPLIPQAVLESVSRATSIPARFLHGAGESQIVGVDGAVLARAPRTGFAVVHADIEVAAARDKRRPDGTDRFAARRPALYQPIASAPGPAVTASDAAASLPVAVIDALAEGPDAIASAAHAVAGAAARGAELIVLPELFCFAGGRVDDAAAGARRSRAAIEALAGACGPRVHVVTSLVVQGGDGLQHAGVVIGARGIVGQQAQVHGCRRHAWAALGAELRPIELAWGRLGLAVGDDAIQPETIRLLALAGAEVVAVPFAPQEAWELELGLIERSAENRVCLIAATRPGPLGTSLVTTLEEDFTIMTPWKTRAFDGLLSHPLVTRATLAGATHATIHPRRAHNKVVSHRTDLLAGRPWHLAHAIVARRTLGTEEVGHV